MLSAVPQVAVFSLVFFNIHLCGLLVIMSDIDIVNFADNNTLYMSAENAKCY